MCATPSAVARFSTDLNVTARQGRITAFMGPSGTGKTTLLRLITGQSHAERGSVRVFGAEVSTMSSRELFALRRRMGMLFQNGALLTDLDVYENVAFPLRAHTNLPESLVRQLVLTKLHAVGLRGAARLMPAELSGGMARRVALARAIVMDPDILIYDEPFVGLDPISMGVICRLIKQMNEALGITSIVVSHDVQELSSIAHDSFLLSEGRVVASGTPEELARSDNAEVRQFMGGLADGPVPFHYPGAGLRRRVVRRRRRGEQMSAATDSLPVAAVRRVGSMTLFLGQILARIVPALRRPGLIVAPDLQRRGAFAGHHHAVGHVRRHGARPAGLRRVPALRLRGLRRRARRARQSQGAGAGAHGAAVCRARRYFTDLRNRPHEVHRAAHRDADDGGGSAALRRRAALSRRLHRHAAAGRDVHACIALYGAQLIGVQQMGVDAGAYWSQTQNAVDLHDVWEGVVKSLVFGVAVSLVAVYEGYHSEPTPEGVGLATTRTVVISSVLVLLLNYLLTAAFLTTY